MHEEVSFAVLVVFGAGSGGRKPPALTANRIGGTHLGGRLSAARRMGIGVGDGGYNAIYAFRNGAGFA